MTPEDLAARHPRLYHLTDPSNLDSIRRHGLLPTHDLLALFEVPDAQRPAIEGGRRPASVTIGHPIRGTATISDNLPLSEAALATCLDDGLAPADWLRTLNARVFFWADQRDLATLRNARAYRGKPRIVLVVDTLSLARRHLARVEISAINSGATIRKPARRGLATFVPAQRHAFEVWSRLRGGRDRIKEVTVLGGVPDILDHVVRCEPVPG